MFRIFLLHLFSLSAVVIFSDNALVAQPSNSCDGTEKLSGSDTMPVALSIDSEDMTDTFTMTGVGCAEVAGDDMVICLRPQNGCIVHISCWYNNPVGGGTTAANLVEGACESSPASCLSSTSGSNGIQTLESVTLNPDTDYCIICSNSVGAAPMDVFVTESAGGCGSLPVSLQRFSVEG